MKNHTEQSSSYRHLEQMGTRQLLENINREDKKVPYVVEKLIPQIEELVDEIVDRMLGGGRLFYLGSGTSGRLGVVDASELPPTFGAEEGMVIGLIAGGDAAIRKAQEWAEDDRDRGSQDLKAYEINRADVVVGIAASGTTPYVVGALEWCREQGIVTAGITCNEETPLDAAADYPIEAPVGPEFVTGSTRMKAGTAQKLILNMISTSVMIKLGRVEDNRMVDMQLTNNKLVERGTQMVMDRLGLSYGEAKKLLVSNGSVRKSIEQYGGK